jgi:hypothetical protein
MACNLVKGYQCFRETCCLHQQETRNTSVRLLRVTTSVRLLRVTSHKTAILNISVITIMRTLNLRKLIKCTYGYLVSELCPLSGIPNNTAFVKVVIVLSSGKMLVSHLLISDQSVTEPTAL